MRVSNTRPDSTSTVTIVATVMIASALSAPALHAQQAAPAPARGELRVTILHTSDEHSAVLPSPLVELAAGNPAATRGGFARLATIVAELRRRKTEAGEPVLLTSSGDHTGGSPFSWLMREGEAPELTLMVEMGYDAITLGNHEFDHGPARLAASLAAAGFPHPSNGTAIVATNMRTPEGHPLAERGVRRTHLDTLSNGLRVGFIGLMGRGAARVAPAAEPVEFGNPNEAAAAAAELRAAGAQLIIALTHSGLGENRSLAREVPEIDVILGGHDHRLVEAPMHEGETIIVHPGASLGQLFVLELGVDRATGGVHVRNGLARTPFVVPLDGSIADDPAIAARIAAFQARVEARIGQLTGGRFSALDSTVARSTFTLGDGEGRESPLGNFITDAMRTAASEATGAPVDFAFQANGNLRGDVRPGEGGEHAGRIVLHDLGGVAGMGSARDGTPGYPIIAVRLTGEEVRRVLELSILLSEVLGGQYFLQVSGLRARYDPARAAWFRIPFNGTPIPSGRAVLSAERDSAGTWVPLERGDERLYHVVTDRYVAAFLPMVGRLVPQIAVVPKRADGTPFADIDDATVMRDGRALPVWLAVVEHAAAQPANGDDAPRIPERYSAVEGRLVTDRGVPLWIWPLLVLIAWMYGAVWLVRRIRRRRLLARPAAA